MLVVTRKAGEALVVGRTVTVKILAIEGDRVRVGIEAPREISILRAELVEAVRAENVAAVSSDVRGAKDLPGAPVLGEE